jgi:acyl-CoA thioester hydrolase
MAGIVHFSRLIDYVEEAEHALFLQAGIPVFGSGSLWPRVRLEVDFLSSATFGDSIVVELSISRIGKSSVAFDFRILRQDVPVCAGKWVICHSLRNSAGSVEAAPIPQEWAHLLQHHAG